MARRKPSLKADIAALVLFGAALAAIAHANHFLGFVGIWGGRTFLEGFVRVAYPFWAGVLLYRYRLHERAAPLPASLLAAALAAMLFMPALLRSGTYDSACVLAAIPFLVAFGARATHSASELALWRWWGRLSYPFYLVHEPVLRFWMHTYRHLFGSFLPSVGAASGLLAAGLLTAPVLLLYDEPLRAQLAAMRNRASGKAGAAAVEAV